jgi:Ran GTPase-activating protein (RanGAP) involved in mRNA processing and transport
MFSGESEALSSLDLSWNHIRGKGAVAIAAGIKGNQMLKKLNLSFNGFSDGGALAVVDALKANNTLQEIDLSENRIGVNGATTLAKALTSNDGLKVLKCGHNPLLTDGVKAMLTALQNNTGSSLEYLDFSGITVGPPVPELVEALKESHPKLTVKYEPCFARLSKKPLHPQPSVPSVKSGESTTSQASIPEVKE